MYFTKKNYLVLKVKQKTQTKATGHTEAAATSMIMVTPLKNILFLKILGSRGALIPPSAPCSAWV